MVLISASVGLLYVPIARATPRPRSAPAGIGDYSYIQFRGFDRGNSDYFGASSQGTGVKVSYQVTGHAYVIGAFDHFHFDEPVDGGFENRTALGLGLQGTAGKVSAYLQVSYDRAIATGRFNGARSYYWQIAYGNRIALNSWLEVDGEVYSDIHPEFGSRPYGVKLGMAGTFGPITIGLYDDHNPDVNSLEAVLQFGF